MTAPTAAQAEVRPLPGEQAVWLRAAEIVREATTKHGHPNWNDYLQGVNDHGSRLKGMFLTHAAKAGEHQSPAAGSDPELRAELGRELDSSFQITNYCSNEVLDALMPTIDRHIAMLRDEMFARGRDQGSAEVTADCFRAINEAKARYEADLAATRAQRDQGVEGVRNPDHVYDKANWEWTATWIDRDTLTDGLDFGEIMQVGTLFNGPDHWAANVAKTFDDEGNADETEVRWFSTRDEAEAACDAGSPLFAPTSTPDRSALEVLREVEWSNYGNKHNAPSCPICGSYQSDTGGHEPDCRLKAALQQASGERETTGATDDR